KLTPATTVPTTVAARPTPATTVPTSVTAKPATVAAASTIAAAIPSAITVKTVTVAVAETRPAVPQTTNLQFRQSKNLNEQFIPQISKTRTKRQLEICRACDNIPGIGAVPLFNGERNGQLAIVYGVDARGCRTANIVCDSRPLIMQTAIIYANGIKTNLLTMSPTGMAQLTLTCDDNIHWKAPKSITNVWNVTCLLRDIPIPTTPLPPVTTPSMFYLIFLIFLTSIESFRIQIFI
ncbi:unnamed protein product, partial [Wuchereria bancrofti]